MSKWTHAICDDCWAKREPGRGAPTRIKEEYVQEEPCCYCKQTQKSGIYVREDPTTAPCKGNHQGEEL